MIAGVAGTALMAQPAMAVVTFDFADVIAGADATVVNPNGGNELTDTADSYDLQEATSLPAGTLAASAFAAPFVTGADAAGNADVSVDFASATSGVFDFTAGAQAFVSAVGGNATADPYYLAADYLFTLTESATFALDYEVGGTGSPTLDFALSGGTFSQLGSLTGTGTREFTLGAGSYTFSLVHNGASVTQSGPGIAFANSFSGASFLITEIGGPVVPEPATWALMIGGFGLVGGTMRSARRSERNLATA
ncbi:PEPxxWA-CTERM sorting domain-containing protein [Sphingomonas sp. 1P06PA]|uniref:PEPxxWA-CTERM sorting domain-containing protein n=1 Tax=Sphingomonas sp. 1P06PA TaxID=554121 RepID=UPI0039A5BF3C